MNSSLYKLKITFALILVCSAYVVAGVPSIALGQGTGSSSSAGSHSTKKQTSGGSLDVILQTSQLIGHTNPTSMKVEFLTKGTGTVQPHIDYDLIIKDSSGKQVFSASQLAGQPGAPLHTAEGVVTIPYTFQGPGDYTINVIVYGILFNPIKPESADFTIKAA